MFKWIKQTHHLQVWPSPNTQKNLTSLTLSITNYCKHHSMPIVNLQLLQTSSLLSIKYHPQLTMARNSSPKQTTDSWLLRYSNITMIARAPIFKVLTLPPNSHHQTTASPANSMRFTDSPLENVGSLPELELCHGREVKKKTYLRHLWWAHSVFCLLGAVQLII